MKFSKYIWDLYINSEKGKEEIAFYQPKNLLAIAKKFDFYTRIEYENDTFKPFEYLKQKVQNQQLNKNIQLKELFNELIIKEVDKFGKDNYFHNFIQACSAALYECFPDFFVPFYFEDNFLEFIQICENFDINLPNYPPRNNWKERAWYYYNLCEVLQRFRIKHEILPIDFPAFLHGFAIDTLVKENEEELQKPSMAYFMGGSKWDSEFLDNATKNDSNVWGAGNLNIRKGDIIIMYCLSPRSYIHSIWRAIGDSYINPNAHYYYQVKIGFPILTPKITLKDLKENEIFKNHPTVRGNMQGLNGRPVNSSYYSELGNLFKLKNEDFNRQTIPKLPTYDRRQLNINYEADVEEQLIEPLLKDLGFTEKDWVRQMPLRMGRSTKYYPDYAIIYDLKKGSENSKYILEAKYSISNVKQLEEAFWQACSYGQRLQSEKIILADLDFVWVFQRKNGNFDNIPIFKKHWNELNKSDNIHLLKQLIKK